MSIWDRIEALKKANGWTDLDVARQFGRESKSWLSNIRKGVAGPGSDAALKLPDVLGIQDENERNRVIVEFLSCGKAA